MKIVRVYDKNDNFIPFDRCKVICWDDDKLYLKIYDYDSELSQRDITILMELINDKIEYGVSVDKARNYIDLLDKLEKIVRKE